MLYYDRIDISEGTDHTESNRSKECMIFRYWFFNHEFKSQDFVWNGFHDLTILCINISNIAITTVNNVDYRCIIHNSKSEAINLLENSALEDYEYNKKYCLNFQPTEGSFFYFFLLLYIK